MAAALAYLCRNGIAVAEKTIRTELSIGEDTMGLILGPAFFWAYALGQIPGGLLGQRFGSRTCLPLCAALSSAMTALLAAAFGPAVLLAARVGGGAAQAGLFPCACLSIARWFPRGERGVSTAVLGAAMSVGAALGAALTGELLKHLDWRSIFALFALPGLAWSLGFYWWFRETPAEHPGVNAAELALITGQAAPGADSPGSGELCPPSRSNRSWVVHPALWLICGQQFFRAAGAAFFASWFATYLQETRGVSTAMSGWLLTIPLLATVLGSLCGGGWTDAIYRRTGRLRPARSGLAGAFLLMCTVLVLGAYFVSDATIATALIGAGAFCAAIAGPCAYAATIDLGGRNVGAVFSTMNMIGNFGAGLLPWIVPAFRRCVQNSPQTLALVGGESWNAVLVLFAAMYLGAAVCWLLLPVREHALQPA